ncbi:calphotin [Neodiprion lecontei]|uniref:Calphotin n=1 Tax=Neodiprion lecontei TaxID=441921 RepID=A0A6J0BQN1_NEOLC|nr:calphotin [Neodiprion lecontei]
MQTALILLSSALAVSTGSIVSLVPISYVASPLPTYNHVQNTLTGEYAYNYAGGPSAKEEIKTLDGVTRGAYSYIDAFGIVQSAQYVADKDGFRIAATNVPTDAQVGVNVPLETPEVQVAKASHFAEHAKAVAALGRRKRSLSHAATAVSSQYHHQEHESLKLEAPLYEQYLSAAPLQAYTSYQAPVAVSTVPTAVSHQSRSQTHNNARIELSAPLAYAQLASPVAAVPEQVISYHEAVAPVAVSTVPTAVSHQSRSQTHNNARIELSAPLAYAQFASPVAAVPEQVIGYQEAVAPVAVSTVPTAVSHQSRSQTHNNARIELSAPLAYAQFASPVAAVPEQVISYHEAVAPVAVAAVPTAVSSQSRFQVHNSQTVEVQSPAHLEPVVSVAPAAPAAPGDDSVVVEAKTADAAAIPVATVASVPTAVSSQSRTQVHSGQRVEIEAPQVYATRLIDSYGNPAVAVSSETLYAPSHLVAQLPQDTPEVAAAKVAHAKAYAAELEKHQGW